MREGVRLGVDVGAVRVGVAVSDPRGVLASPLETLPRMADADGTARPATTEDADIARLVALAAEHAVVEVVVGLPRALSGTEGRAAQIARAYASVVARCLAPISVRLVDERLTSVDAHRALRESGVSGRRQRAVVDQAAAVLILQSALDEERSSGHPPGEPVRNGRRKPRAKDGQR